MKLGNIIKELEKNFPKQLAEKWDNVGLLVGDREQKIKKIMILLDATEKAIDYAIEKNVDLIITHHPMIFSPLKSIDYSEIIGRKIIKLIKNEISLYTLHTNLDSAKDGLNEYIGNYLGLSKGKILERNDFQENSGIGRVYKLEEKSNIHDIIELVKRKLNLENVNVVLAEKSESESVEKIAVINGSGMSYWKLAKKLGADIVITGDVKYHEALDAKEAGISIIDVGHYESEIIFKDIIKKYLDLDKIEIEDYLEDKVFKMM